MTMAVAVATALPLLAYTWTDPDTGYTWTYKINGEEAEIYKGSTSPAVSPAPTGILEIPAMLGGKEVTSIGDYAFYGCNGFTGVEIPDSVTKIGVQAFYGCSKLRSVLIPYYLESVGSRAFGACSAMTAAVFLGDKPSMGESIFYQDSCTVYVSEYAYDWDVEIPGKWNGLDIRYCEGEQVVGGYTWTYRIIGETAEIYNGSSAAVSPEPTGAVTIPSTLGGKPVSGIGDYAFYACWDLTGVTIPDSVTRIGKFAFCCCESLKSVNIPSGVKSIGDDAFDSCSSLASVTIPGSVKSIGDSAFYNCSMLTSMTMGNGVRSIGCYAFYNCCALKSVTIPDSVKSIDDFAFSCCSGLASLTVGSGVASMGQGAFFSCFGLASLTIRNGVKVIGYSAFYNCCEFTSVTIPGSVTSIGDFAFEDCSKLKTVTYLGNCPETGDFIYDGDPNNLVSIVPAGNSTWSSWLAAGTWQDRAIKTDAPELTIGGGKTSMSRAYSCAAKTGESFSVACDGSWTATSSVSWITITSGSSGSGNGMVKYKLSENTGTAKREGAIKVKCGSITRTCKITQDKPLLIGGKTSLSRSYENTKQSGCYFSVTCSQSPWTAVSSASWVTLTSDSKSGTGSGKVTYSVAANTSSSQRTATIKVTSRSLTRTCTIIQKAGAAPTLTIGGGKTSMSRAYSCAAKTGESFSVACNGSWTATASASWITITSGASGSGNGTIKYNLAANTGTSKREGKITVKCGSITRICTITQDKPLLIGGKTSLTRSYEATKQTGCYFSVTCSQSPWTAVSSASWVTLTSDSKSGTGSGKVTYSVAANTSTSQRTATIKVTSRGLTRTCTIKQKGK